MELPRRHVALVVLGIVMGGGQDLLQLRGVLLLGGHVGVNRVACDMGKNTHSS